jgi:guanylate kinase
MSEPVGNVFVIAAPSGAGKSSLVNALLADDPSLALSVSCTTRKPRTGEIEGKDYRFVSMEAFESLQRENKLLEWAQVHENYYGTPRDKIDQAVLNGQDILLEIDWQGALQVRKALPSVVGIFILPPSIDALLERLQKRATDTDEVIAKRIQAADSEISHASEFEYVIINQVFTDALAELKTIISSVRLRYAKQQTRHRSLFNQFGLDA